MQGDLAGHYGGGEFVVVLPNTGEDGATQVTARLLDLLQDMRIEWQAGICLYWRGAGVQRVTLEVLRPLIKADRLDKWTSPLR